MTPRHGLPGATPSAIPEPPFRFSSVMGAAGLCSRAASSSLTVQKAVIAARLGAMRANGFSSRRLRARNASTADDERASHMR
jgi:hypothetical protein